MLAVSKTDVVCLVVLFCVDLSVYAWWEKDRTIPPDPESIAALIEAEQTPPTVAPTPSNPVTVQEADSENSDRDSGLWEHTYGDYRVKTITASSETEGFILQVFKAGQLVFSTSSHRYFDPEGTDNNDPHDLPPPNTNITGDGLPNLVVAEWSGGAHCCMTYYVFQLSDEFRLIDTVQAEHGDAYFEDLDGDGIPEIQMRDWQYAYEFTAFAGSPAPPIVLRYADGKYQVAPELIFTDPPTDEEFAALVNEVREVYSQPLDGSDEFIPPSAWGGEAIIWRRMLELTYKGHVELAMRLFEECWHADWKDKDEALNQYWKLVGSSPYGRALVEAQEYEWPEVGAEVHQN